MTSSISSMTSWLVVPFHCGILDNDRGPEQCCCFVYWLTARVPWLGHATSVSSFLHRTLRKVCTSQHRPRSVAGISLGLGKICCDMYKGALKTYSTQPTIKERGEEAHVRSAVQGLPHTSSPVSSSPIFLPGIDFVVVQHLIRCLYHKLEKRQQPIVRLIGRSTSLVFGIVSLDFLAVQVSVQFCIRSSSSCSSSWWLIVVRLACRQFSGSGEALGGSGGLCVLSTVTMLHESHPSRWMQLDAKSVGPP